jgi:arylsulfatase A-like enzyme
VKLTRAYANSAVCSPSRTALITGRYQYRLPVGLDEPLTGERDDLGLPPSHPTLPSLLRERGYYTALVGKWHLGDPPQFGPLMSGYDSFHGVLHGWEWYFNHGTPAPGGLYHNERQVPHVGYMTDILGNRAVEEIGIAESRKQPLFLSLHFTAPHWPWQGPDDAAAAQDIVDAQNYDGGSIRTYQKMIASMDGNVAKVLDALDRAGVADNSIVIFTSDNGGERFSDTWPLTGMKGELLEGGIRVPALIRWPGRLRAGTICNQATISMDWLPTLLAAAGGAPDPAYPTDGANLVPILSGLEPPRERRLFWRLKSNEQAAYREGDWKYLKLGGQEWLFNLAEDERERANRRQAQPARFARMKTEYEAWDRSMLPYPASTYSHNIHGLTADKYSRRESGARASRPAGKRPARNDRARGEVK